MKKPVSAKTVQERTLQAATASVDSTPLTIEDLKKHTPPSPAAGRLSFDFHGVAGHAGGSDRSVVSLLEKAEKSPPAGFKLAPLVFSRISKEQNKEIYREFETIVQPAFLKFLAGNHADDLKKLGICEYGIARMGSGLLPIDKSGRHYDVSVDHVIERAGSGKMGLEKEIDPLMPPGSPPTYKVNHFENFILLPQKIHDFKNAINMLQDTPGRAVGTSTWCFMLLPDERDEKNPRFVHTGGAADDPYTAVLRELTPQDLSSQIFHALNRINATFPAFFSAPEVRAAIDETTQVFAIGHDLPKDRVFSQDFVTYVFEAALNGTAQAETWHKEIKPLVGDLYRSVKTFREQYAETGHARKNVVSGFYKVCGGWRMRTARRLISNLPKGIFPDERAYLRAANHLAQDKLKDIPYTPPRNSGTAGHSPKR